MKQISHLARDYFVIKFNGALPVSLEVLRKTSFNRYELKIGHKKMNTKSLKPLKVGHRYWANFAQTREGMIRVNGLKEKPTLLQKETEFLELSSWDFLDEVALKGQSFFKEWILSKLEKTKLRSEFLMLTSMLLSLNEGIFHLPFMMQGRPFLIQWRDKGLSLKQNVLEFYFAFDTLGAIKGYMDEEIRMNVLYEKSANLLQNELFSDKELNIQISQNMLYPLWEGDEGLLNVEA